MRYSAMLATSVACLSWTLASSAQPSSIPHADTPVSPDDNMVAPQHSFELAIAAGYTQPFGTISDGLRVADMVDAGTGFNLDMGYRFHPRWALSSYFHFHESKPGKSYGEGAAVHGGAAGLQTTFHIDPFIDAEPYVTVGAGYRILWIVPDGPVHMLHGFEVAKLLVGLDFRVGSRVSLGPFLGADVNVLLWDDTSSAGVPTAIPSPRPVTFLFGGLSARFDIGGTRVDRNGAPRFEQVASRQER